MKSLRIYLIIILSIGLSYSSIAGKKEIQFSVSEPDAKIYVNDKLCGRGSALIVIPAYQCVIVKIEKSGFITGVIEFCNKPEYNALPKVYHYKLEQDDSLNASDESEYANVDIQVKTEKTEDMAWKTINQTILSYFDEVEINDPKLGYLRTAWVIQSFKEITVRTRVIVKLVGSNPLTYKIKLASEIADEPKTSGKNDELFKEWNRILKKYKEIIMDLQSKISH